MQIKIIATVSKRGRTYKTHSDIEDSEKRYKLIRQEMIPDSISVVNKKWIADRLKQLYGAARPNETENKIIDDRLEKLDEAARPKATDNKSIDERLKELDEAALPKLEEIKLWEKYGRIVAETEFETVAPRPELVGFLRFNRRAFVQNKTTATFTNGVLTGLSSTDPSSIVGFIMLPTELLKSVTFLVQI